MRDWSSCWCSYKLWRMLKLN